MLAIFGAISLSIVVFFVLYRFRGIGDVVHKLTDILAPFIYGGVVAYLLRPMCNHYERGLRHLLPRKIKGLANTTPNEMIQIIRLKKAASLLLENQYRINEVSYMVGFNNPSYFSKCFQKQFGMKPGEYIASHAHKTE